MGRPLHATTAGRRRDAPGCVKGIRQTRLVSHFRTVSPLSATPSSHHNAVPPQSTQCHPYLSAAPHFNASLGCCHLVECRPIHHSVAPQHSAAINAISPSTQCHHTAQRLPYIQCRLLTVPPAPYFNAAPYWDAAIGREPPPSSVAPQHCVLLNAMPPLSTVPHLINVMPPPRPMPPLTSTPQFDGTPPIN